MRILIVMDPGILVPPRSYGGHERLVYMFAKEYARLGHEVHLLVTKGSLVEGCTVHGFGKEGFPPKKISALMAIPKVWWFLLKYGKRFDLIHNFGRLAYLLPVISHSVKKIMTYGREITTENIKNINKLKNINLVFTGCSDDLISRGSGSGRWKTVYNAIDFRNYKLNETIEESAPLMFLGRIERVKGCHIAIRVALETGNSLIIGGNISPLPDEKKYFKERIEPYIDGKQIIFLGPLNDIEKNTYLGKAKALLFPIEWDEPFGMVMVEAMACGTPVIAFKRGSVPEVVEDEKNGYVVNDLDEMKKKLKFIFKISRSENRNIAYKKFDVSVIAKTYLSLFDSEIN